LIIAVEWMALLCIWHDPGSDTVPKTGCFEETVSLFSTVTPDKRDTTLDLAAKASFHILSNSFFTNHPTVVHYVA
jgi:hypothetical protein